MRDQVSSMRAKGIQAFQLSEKTDPKEIQEVSLSDESADWDRSSGSSGWGIRSYAFST
jgi:uncharacterized protein (DUF934 family)